MSLFSKYKILIGLSIVLLIGFKLYMDPKDFINNYTDVHVYENGNNIDKLDIEIDGKIYKNEFILREFKFSELLEGKIRIGNNEYDILPKDTYIFPNEDGIYTDNNLYQGILAKDKDWDNFEYYFYLKQDNSNLYISNRDESKEMAYPVQEHEDYINLKKYIKSTY